jgi:hypothetical protein
MLIVKNGMIYPIAKIGKAKIGVVAGLVVTAKKTAVNILCSIYERFSFTCGADGYTRYTTQVGQVIGTTTGNSSGLISTDIEVLLTAPMGSKKAGEKVYISSNDVNISAGAQATGAGFPISLGSRGAGVFQLQNYLVSKGFSLGTVDGIWGNNTQNAVSKAGLPSVINSQAELNQITASGVNQIPVNPNPTPTNPTPTNPTPIPTDMPQTQSQGFLGLDATTLAVGGLVLWKLLSKKKGKRKKKR